MFTVPALYAAQTMVRGTALTWDIKDVATGAECTAGLPGLLTRQCSVFMTGYQADVNYFKEEDLTIYNVSNVVMGFWIVYGLLGALRKLNNEEAQMVSNKKQQ